MEKVSIIIPVYNSERFIELCIESLIHQTYQELEIIMIDDGSTDRSAEIINKYAQNDSRIILLQQPNKGASIARNYGISKATGEYMIFLDSDDVLCNNSIEVMLKYIVDRNADLIVGNYEEIDENNKEIRKIKKIEKIEEYKEQDIFKCVEFVPYPGNKLYRSKIIKDNNIYFADVKIGQDLNFYLKYLLYATSVVSISELIAKYRIVFGGISRTYNLKILDIINSFKDIKDIYLKEGRKLEYDNYISVIEMLNYSTQMNKIIYFKEKKEKKIAVDNFKKHSKNIYYGDKVLLKKYKKRYIKFKIKLLFGNLLTTNIYYKLMNHSRNMSERGKENV